MTFHALEINSRDGLGRAGSGLNSKLSLSEAVIVDSKTDILTEHLNHYSYTQIIKSDLNLQWPR